MKNSLALKIGVTAAVILALVGGGIAFSQVLAPPKVVEPASSSTPVVKPKISDRPAIVPAAASSSSSSSSSKPPVREEEPKPEREPYYVMLIGNDTRKGTVDEGLEKFKDDRRSADTIMLVRIDPKDYVVSILSIPRETPSRYQGKNRRLSTVYQDGWDESIIGAVKEITGIEAKYYLDMTFAQFVNFYNAIGGVDVNAAIPINHPDIMTGEEIYIDAGEQHLNGNEALVFARVRKMYAYGDACRQYNSRHMVMTTIRQAASDPGLAMRNLDILLGHVATNWPVEELKAEVQNFVEHADRITFYEGTGPYEGDPNPDFGGTWVCYEAPETWAALVEEFKNGRDPSTVYPLAPMNAAA